MALRFSLPLTEMSTMYIPDGVKRGHRVRPTLNRLSKKFEASTSYNPKSLHGLEQLKMNNENLESE
jgi:hypothetical protein